MIKINPVELGTELDDLIFNSLCFMVWVFEICVIFSEFIGLRRKMMVLCDTKDLIILLS